VTVSVSGLPSGFSTAVYVDSLQEGDISGGERDRLRSTILLHIPSQWMNMFMMVLT